MSKAPRKKDSTQSGGINVDADKLNVGKDVVGRDQITRANEDVVEHDKITNVYNVTEPVSSGQPKWLIPVIILAVAALVVVVVVVSSLSAKQPNTASVQPTAVPSSAVDLAHLKPNIDVTAFAAPDTASEQLFTVQVHEEIPVAVQGRYDVGSVRWLIFRSPNSGDLAFVDSAAFGPPSDFQSLPIIQPAAASASGSDQSAQAPAAAAQSSTTASATARQDSNAVDDHGNFLLDDNGNNLVVPSGAQVIVLGGAVDAADSVQLLCVAIDAAHIGWVNLSNFDLSTSFDRLPTKDFCLLSTTASATARQDSTAVDDHGNVLGSVPSGTQVIVLGGAVDAGNAQLLCVAIDANHIGWVNLSDFDLSTSFDSLPAKSACP